MAPFLVSIPFSLAPSLLIFSYCHSQVATRVFFFLYLIFFWFLPSFPFLLHIFFPFPSLLFWRPFSFPFFLSLSLLLSFSPFLFGAPLRPPGVQAHAMHPPGYATENFDIFFQLNEMRDEAKTWWLLSGPDVASSYFFLKKIRVALESRTLIWVPLLQAMTLNENNQNTHR